MSRRKLTAEEMITFRGFCEEKARLHAKNTDLNEQDIQDVISTAYIKGLRSLGRIHPRMHMSSILRMVADWRVLDAMDAYNRYYNLMHKQAFRLDAPKHGKDEEEMREGFQIKAPEEVPNPSEWQRMFRLAVTTLSKPQRKVFRALKKGLAIKKCVKFGVDIKKFQVHFAQCFQAYCEWRRKVDAFLGPRRSV